MLKLMLVDDEPLARQRLRRLIDEGKYRVVAEADSGQAALEQVKQHQPDIILMDIRMPGMDGLQAAAELAKLASPPAVVFCTAYDEYALSAFDVQAVGYVLKPIRKEQLDSALAAAQRVTASQLAAVRSGGEVKYLTVKTHHGTERVALSRILYFMADHKYVTAYAADGEWLLDDSLKQLETELGDDFVRIHRNCLVAVNVVKGLKKGGGGYDLVLEGVKQTLPVSRRLLGEVRERFGF